MKNIVSFETAKKLEAAGFERPTPEIGQFWYTPNGRLYHIVEVNRSDIFVKWHNGESWSSEMVVYDSEYDNWFYAATATDILEKLPNRYVLSKDGTEWLCGAECFWGDTFEGYNPRFTHENAAEAVAEAFLLQAKIK